MDNTATYHKAIKAATSKLTDIRKFVAKHAQEHGFNEKQISDIQLAVDEACTNIIKHAYQFDQTKNFMIELEFDGNQLSITLTDYGTGFDPNRYQKPDLKKQIEKKKRGGMGIFIIKNLMDDVSYTSLSDKNVLRMSKIRN